ncbi:hypothetical protein FND36_15495 [Lachnospiraceae bacterium KGMB03038]|nr:hypothetical protein FND36_15495 [Lachnospiraceae bacterium KGMB03038]
MKKRGKIKAAVIVLAVLLGGFCICESRPIQVYSSSIFTSQGSASIRLCVVVNSLLPIDRKQVAEEVVEENIRINGPRPEAVYELEIYRTDFHYRHYLIWDVIYCDSKGKILPPPFARESGE